MLERTVNMLEPDETPRDEAYNVGMNTVLWRKAIHDSWRQLLASSVLLVLFGWVFVWLMSQFRPGAMGAIISFLPKFVEPMLGVPLVDLATTAGRMSFLYVHVVVMLLVIGWAVGRGSDVVAGEIARGTMDLLLAMPIRRASLLLASGTVAAAGSAVLALSIWLGHALGLRLIEFPEPVSATRFLPGAINLFAMTFCLTGLTTLFSSWGRDRWRTVLWAGGLFVLSAVLKMVARLWLRGEWLKYLSFLTAFEPQKLILLPPEEAAALAWRYNLTLVGLGLSAYLLAAAIFTCRDIPAHS